MVVVEVRSQHPTKMAFAQDDHVVEETQKYGTASDLDVTYRYDLPGRLGSVEYPSGLTLSYTYDDVGRAYKVNDGTRKRPRQRSRRPSRASYGSTSSRRAKVRGAAPWGESDCGVLWSMQDLIGS